MISNSGQNVSARSSDEIGLTFSIEGISVELATAIFLEVIVRVELGAKDLGWKKSLTSQTIKLASENARSRLLHLDLNWLIQVQWFSAHFLRALARI